MRIKNIRREIFEGIVYNLGVKEDHTYFADGILVHNCRSVIVPVTRYEADDLADADDVPDRKELQGMGANLLSIKAEVKR